MTVLHSMASDLAEKRYMYARVYKKGSTYAYANWVQLSTASLVKKKRIDNTDDRHIDSNKK